MTEEAPKRTLQQEIVSWLLAAVLIYFSFRIVSPFLTPLICLNIAVPQSEPGDSQIEWQMISAGKR